MPTDYRDSARRVTLLGRCREMRHAPSEAEARLWSRVRGRQLMGFKFRRQHQVGPYIVDFFCPERSLAIEVDGGQHALAGQAAHDRVRARYLAEHGVRVLRFSCEQVLAETDAVIESVLMQLDGPHPDPLPEGEGD